MDDKADRDDEANPPASPARRKYFVQLGFKKTGSTDNKTAKNMPNHVSSRLIDGIQFNLCEI